MQYTVCNQSPGSWSLGRWVAVWPPRMNVRAAQTGYLYKVATLTANRKCPPPFQQTEEMVSEAQGRDYHEAPTSVRKARTATGPHCR